MATYTLPNGSTWNTGLDYFSQTDESAYKFIREIETANTPTKIFISGSNVNIPRITQQQWIESSYDNYNYIRTSTYTYEGDTYTRNHVLETFEIQNK
jgi:hypothetical protein